VPDTALHTARWLDELEAAVRKPVLTANQVTMWEALRLAGRPVRATGPGRLFALVAGRRSVVSLIWGLHWDAIRRVFTGKLPECHHLRERIALDEDDQLDFYELRHFGASHMLNDLEIEPWVIAEQLRHSDGGRLVIELYGHPDRRKALDRIRRAYTGAKVAPIRGTDRQARSGRKGKLGGQAS
jgi:hypothetical protein